MVPIMFDPEPVLEPPVAKKQAEALRKLAVKKSKEKWGKPGSDPAMPATAQKGDLRYPSAGESVQLGEVELKRISSEKGTDYSAAAQHFQAVIDLLIEPGSEPGPEPAPDPEPELGLGLRLEPESEPVESESKKGLLGFGKSVLRTLNPSSEHASPLRHAKDFAGSTSSPPHSTPSAESMQPADSPQGGDASELLQWVFDPDGTLSASQTVDLMAMLQELVVDTGTPVRAWGCGRPSYQSLLWLNLPYVAWN
jgi:hypothetical protein